MPMNAKFAIGLKSFCARCKISPQQSALQGLRAKSQIWQKAPKSQIWQKAWQVFENPWL